jgi:hypothetical protein
MLGIAPPRQLNRYVASSLSPIISSGRVEFLRKEIIDDKATRGFADAED